MTTDDEKRMMILAYSLAYNTWGYFRVLVVFQPGVEDELRRRHPEYAPVESLDEELAPVLDEYGRTEGKVSEEHTWLWTAFETATKQMNVDKDALIAFLAEFLTRTSDFIFMDETDHAALVKAAAEGGVLHAYADVIPRLVGCMSIHPRELMRSAATKQE